MANELLLLLPLGDDVLAAVAVAVEECTEGTTTSCLVKKDCDALLTYTA